MRSCGGRAGLVPWLVSLAPPVLLTLGCGSAGNAPPAAEGPSHAADAIIEKARTPEERRALEKARDEVDAEMRERVRELDAEIERLRKENERLKRSKP